MADSYAIPGERGKEKGCGQPTMNRSKQGGMAIKPIIILLIGLTLASVRVVEAQQAGKVPRIGYLDSTGDPKTPQPSVEAFRQGLRDLGYIEGKNILVEYRYAEGMTDRMPSLVAELCNSRSIWLSLQLYQRSAQPSRRPRRFPLSW